MKQKIKKVTSFLFVSAIFFSFLIMEKADVGAVNASEFSNANIMLNSENECTANYIHTESIFLGLEKNDEDVPVIEGGQEYYLIGEIELVFCDIGYSYWESDEIKYSISNGNQTFYTGLTSMIGGFGGEYTIFIPDILPGGIYYLRIDYPNVMCSCLTAKSCVSFYRFYVKSDCTLSYNANGGNITPAAQTGKGTISISSDVPERFGYSFLGWSENSGATQASYLPGQTINLNSNLNLYAVWEEAKSAEDSGLIGNAHGVHFQFPGQVFYFHYTPTETRAWMIEYFRLSGETGVFSTGEGLGLYLYDSSGNLLESSKNKDNENDICRVFNAGEKYYIKIDFSENATGGIYVGMIYRNTYTVSYDANGGYRAPAAQTKIQYKDLKLKIEQPSKTYTVTYNANGGSVSTSSRLVYCDFVNWNTAQDGNGTSYEQGGLYTADSDVNLYAQWEDSAIGRLATPTRTGYTFDGWYTAANGGRKVTSTTKISSDTTLYAHWSANTYTCNICSGQFFDEAEYNNHVQNCGKVYACRYCKEEFKNDTACKEHMKVCTQAPTEPTTQPVTPPVANVILDIRRPSTTSITYGDSIILHADIDGTLPAGWRIDWSASNGNFYYSESADGTTCTITPNASGDTEFTATVYDAEGKEVSRDTQTMTSNAGFFRKIIAFFKNLFGMNRIIEQRIKFN